MMRFLSVAAIALTLVLTGCSVDPSRISDDRGNASVGSISSADPVEPRAQLAPPVGVIATGTLTSTDGQTAGSVEITSDGTAAVLQLRGLTSSHDRLSARTSNRSEEGNRCISDGAFSFGDFDPAALYSIALPSAMLHGDWSAIEEVVLTLPPDPAEHPDDWCGYVIGARASLVWTMQPLRPWLAELEDSGTRKWATGVVETDADGAPHYVVAASDVIDEVASRFGLTQEELFYLNEDRRPSPENPMLFAGESLNLTLAGR